MTFKKALVAITVVAMLFGMVSTAFAGGFTDVTDSSTAAAAARLNALSIMKGFPDGSFGATATITRAQFAAVAVRALGLDNAATYAKGFTKFSDVSADHWASGYINIASQQGIIAGFPDGTFHPEDPVTYAQALTINVRMLGYGPVTEGKGTWPSNYIVRAAMIGFTSGVSFAAMEPATRGNVALFVDNSLTADMMVNTGAVGTADTYEIQKGTNLLNTYLGAVETSGMLTSSPELLGVTTIAINGGAAKTLADGVSAAGLLGQQVNAWEKGGKVVLVENDESADSVKTGKIAAHDDGAGTITIGTKVYTLAGAAKVFTNGVADGAYANGNEVKLVLNSDGDVKSVVAIGYDTGVVTDTDVDGKLIITDAFTLDFSATQSSSITKNGAAISIADVQADDVVQYYGDVAGNKVVVVTRNAKTGTLTRYNADGSVVIGGATYSQSNAALDLTALTIGSDYTVLLDKYGKIWAINEVSAPAAAKTYALVLSAARTVTTSTGEDYYFTAKKADNTSVYLKLASKVDVGAGPVAADPGMIAADTLIQYTVNSDGLVNGITDVNPVDDPAFALSASTKRAGDLLVTASTVIVDMQNQTFITSADLFKLDAATTGVAIADSTGVRAKLVAISSSTPATPDVPYAYVTGAYKDADGWHVTALAEGKSTAYGADDTITIDGVPGKTAADLTDGVLYVFTFTASSVSAADVSTQSLLAGADHNVALSYDSNDQILTYKAVDANSAKIGNSLYGVFNADTVVIDATGDSAKIGTTATIAAGKTVELYDLDGDNVIDVVIVK